MSEYKCYIKSDPSQEAIAVVKAEGINEAIIYFATQKKLLMEDFVRIFSVSKIER